MTKAQVYAKPLPQPSLESAAFWQGLREHRLLLQRCARCAKIRHYPRPVCDACYAMEYDWAEASGRGTVHSWTVSHHAFHPGFKADLPYTLVTVDLEEGVRMHSRLIGATSDRLRLGLPVEVVFEDVTPELTLAFFRIAPNGIAGPCAR